MLKWTEQDVVDAFGSVMQEPITPAGSTSISPTNPDALSRLLELSRQINMNTGTISQGF